MWGWIGVAMATEGQVTVPLELWQQAAPTSAAGRPAEVLPISRSLVGRLDRGLLDASVGQRFEVRGDGRVAVPVAARAATLVDVRLDGRPAAAREEGDWWVVDAGAGAHEVQLSLLYGERTERFARRLALALPPTGPNHVQLDVPETSIAPTWSGGVLVAAEPVAGGTRLSGWLDADGALSLAWERRADTPLDPGAARLDAEAHAVLALGEDVVTGTGRYRFTVREGEIDRVTLELPPDVEVLDAAGDAVLQWHVGADGRLVALLRHVEADVAEVTVTFQYPAPLDAPVAVRLPLPSAPFVGVVGIEAPVGLAIVDQLAADAEPVAPRDAPRELLSLTEAPLRAAFSFASAPEVTLAVARQPEVAVSTSRVDDLQGITVLVEDGTEVGKLRLSVRNTTRQVLQVDLPEGARLTHCFRDGLPLRPAAGATPQVVLVPLTASARRAEQAVYVVQPGDTLSGIAQRFLGAGSRWPAIADANPGLGELDPGEVLTLPATGDPADEQAFVLELGWERRTDALGQVGARDVALPTLDLEVMAATWHVYLPDAVEPLAIRSPLRLLDRLHADPLTRALDLVAAHVGPAPAYAGEDYKNVLASRRSLYEADQRAQVDLGSDPFPLVGDRYRLQGVLLGTEPPRLWVAWLGREAAGAVRWAAGLAAAVGTLAVALSGRRWAALPLVAVGLLVGHHVLGVHRALAWGVDLGLLGLLGLAWLDGARVRVGWPLFAVSVAWVVRPDLLPVVALGALAHLLRRSS